MTDGGSSAGRASASRDPRKWGHKPKVGGSSPSPRISPYLEWRRGISKHFTIKWGQRLGRSECPYMRRWALVLGLFSIRVHHWYRSDDDRAFHDHPWWFITLVLKGGYTDVSPAGRDHLGLGSIRFRPALHQHTAKVDPGGAWTVILTGPNVRTWGFWINGKFKKSNKWFFERGHHPCDQL